MTDEKTYNKAGKKRAAVVPEEWIDEIPVRPDVFKSQIVCVAALLLLGLGALVWWIGPSSLNAMLEANTAVSLVFDATGTTVFLETLFVQFAALSLICAISGGLGLARLRISYNLMRSSLAVVYVVVALYAVCTWRGVFALLDVQDLEIGGQAQDRATILLLWWKLTWPALTIALYSAWLHVILRSRSVYAVFTREVGEPMSGDYVLEDLRTHGRDPRHRKSLYASAMTHIVVLVIIPFLLSLGGCVTPYRVPKGSGNPVVAMVKVVKPKKKKQKKLALRPNSAIIYEVPDLDHTEVDEMIEEMTKQTYVASNAKAGKMGKGGGTKGGWPAGMENYKIRFIRLEHSGAGWDDGMNHTQADINFLRAFSNATGFNKIAKKGESHSIRLLGKYPDDGFPPFVYLTGNGNMGRVSSGDVKILREYCLKGGLLIGDAGSATFDRSFRHFMRQVFPDKPLLDVADDDMIYQLPNGFPNGAPAFWHHGGRRGLGIKHEGRWCVYYHPGDMNDAWKSSGYTDVSPEMRDAAINLGVNLVYYAFNQWDDAVTKARK